jgi:hypothetical protein
MLKSLGPVDFAGRKRVETFFTQTSGFTDVDF